MKESSANFPGIFTLPEAPPGRPVLGGGRWSPYVVGHAAASVHRSQILVTVRRITDPSLLPSDSTSDSQSTKSLPISVGKQARTRNYFACPDAGVVVLECRCLPTNQSGIRRPDVQLRQWTEPKFPTS